MRLSRTVNIFLNEIGIGMTRTHRLATSTFVKLMFVGLTIAMSAMAAHPSFADTLMLKNGSLVEGRCLNASDKNAKEWQIETTDGILLTISRSEVSDFRTTTQEHENYLAIFSKLKADDVDSLETHRNFVKWCNANGLRPLVEAHSERIVELDPSDKTAWAELGYLSTDQGWIRRDLYQKRRGLQQKGTKWYIPQDLAIQTANAQAKELSAKVSQEVVKAIASAKTNSPKAAEARQFLAQLKDPFAVPKIKELLEKDRGSENPQFRLQMVEILGRIRSASSVKALIASTLSDPDSTVRAKCIDKLTEFGRDAAIESFLLLLTNREPTKDKPEVYDRIGEALVVLGDERCIERLLDCLVTDHVITPPPQPSNQASQQKNGNVNFGSGQPPPKKVQIKNDGVLNALVTISNGENYAFDVEAWRNWYARKYASQNPYVLRDP
jgi:HEAT repeats